MLKYFFLWLIGAASVSVSGGDVARVTEALFSLGLPVIMRHRRRGDGGRTMLLRERDLAVFEELCCARGITYEVRGKFGLPVLIYRYRYRAGLFIGAVLLVAAIFISDDFVWRIDVSGNDTIPSETIIAELETLGFGLGTYHKNIDFDILHNRFLLNSPDIAWIAINMKGSVARVEVREYMPGGAPPPKAHANIVAACDGVITQVSPFSGSPQVRIGEEVKKGQLLISGIVEYEGVSTEYVYARGEVYAEVEREIYVRIPLVSEEKVKTDDVRTEYGIKFFGDEIFFGRRGRIDALIYDTITEERDLVLFHTVALPIKVIEERYERYETVPRTLTPEEAAATAYREYKLAFIEACRDVTLLSYVTENGMSEDGTAYEILCRLRVIDDIAETREFEVTE